MENLLWLDDIRNPYINEENRVPSSKNGKAYNINWVLNYKQFTQWIQMYGLPDAISFDHDLAEEHYTPEYFWNNYEESKKFQDWKYKTYKEKTGKNCAIWLVEYCKEKNLNIPKFHIHSANPVGVDYIKEVLNQR
jgi:hypothetical protein